MIITGDKVRKATNLDQKKKNRPLNLQNISMVSLSSLFWGWFFFCFFPVYFYIKGAQKKLLCFSSGTTNFSTPLKKIYAQANCNPPFPLGDF